MLTVLIAWKSPASGESGISVTPFSFTYRAHRGKSGRIAFDRLRREAALIAKCSRRSASFTVADVTGRIPARRTK